MQVSHRMLFLSIFEFVFDGDHTFSFGNKIDEIIIFDTRIFLLLRSN